MKRLIENGTNEQKQCVIKKSRKVREIVGTYWEKWKGNE